MIAFGKHEVEHRRRQCAEHQQQRLLARRQLDQLQHSPCQRQAYQRILANRGDAKTVAEAQEQLVQAAAQLQALERLRRNLKH